MRLHSKAHLPATAGTGGLSPNEEKHPPKAFAGVGLRKISIGALLAVIVGFLVTVVPGVRSSPGYSVWLDGVWQSAAFFAAALICTLRLPRRSAHRPFWLCVNAALYLDAAAETLWFWTVGESNAGEQASIADIAWVGFYLAILAGFAVLVVEHLRHSNATVVCDGAIVGFGAAAAGATLVGPYLAWSDDGTVVNLINIGYPVLDLAFLVAILAIITIYRWRPPAGVWLVVAALVTWGVADFLYVLEVSENDYLSGGLGDALFVIAATATAFAPGRPATPRQPVPHWVTIVIPVAAVTTAVLVLFFQDVLDSNAAAKWLALGAVAAAGARLSISYSESRRSADHVRLAHTDDLTGLLNRRGFFREHARLIRPIPFAHAVYVLDFDRFKDINDSLGHHFGDDLLRAVARRITETLPGEHIIARFGGDEFVIAIRTSERDEAESTAAALFDVLTRPFDLAGLDVQVGVSIGIAICPTHGTETTTLLRHADHAMFRSKRGGLPPTVYAAGEESVEPLSAGRSGMELLAEFRAATHARELDVHYQPIRHVASGRVVGAEALLRWHHPVHGMLGPALLIPLAVRHGMMGQLTRAVLDIAVAEAAAWWADGYRISVSVNISPLMLEQGDLVEAVVGTTSAAGLSPAALVVEITEDSFIHDYVRTREILDQLRSLGVRISLDDFGQGHSILEYLKELTIDEVKLDRSFIAPLAEDRRTVAIVKAIIALAHDLDVSVVAEGIETEDSALRLADYGADLAQGNYFCEPLSSAKIRDYLADHRAHGTVLRAD